MSRGKSILESRRQDVRRSTAGASLTAFLRFGLRLWKTGTRNKRFQAIPFLYKVCVRWQSLTWDWLFTIDLTGQGWSVWHRTAAGKTAEWRTQADQKRSYACCTNNHSKQTIFSSSQFVQNFPFELDDIGKLHCCACIDSFRTFALALRLYTPCLACGANFTLLPGYYCVSLVVFVWVWSFRCLLVANSVQVSCKRINDRQGFVLWLWRKIKSSHTNFVFHQITEAALS